jgi:hypothetical protein
VNLLGLGIELAPGHVAPRSRGTHCGRDRPPRLRLPLPRPGEGPAWPGLPRTTGIYGAPPVGSRSRCGTARRTQ